MPTKRERMGRWDFSNVDRGHPIDLQHPLMKGVLACWLGPDWGGLDLRDCVGRYNMAAYDGPTVEPSSRGRALAFDVGPHLMSGAGTTLVEPLSMTSWFNVVNVTADHILVGLANPGTDKGFYLSAAGAYIYDPIMAMTISGGIYNRFALSDGIGGYSANKWQHAAGVFEKTDFRSAFLNGRLKGTNTQATEVHNATRAGLGCFPRTVPTATLEGLLGVCTIWKRVLSDRELYEDYEEGLRGFPTILRRTTGFRAFMVPTAGGGPFPHFIRPHLMEVA